MRYFYSVVKQILIAVLKLITKQGYLTSNKNIYVYYSSTACFTKILYSIPISTPA